MLKFNENLYVLLLYQVLLGIISDLMKFSPEQTTGIQIQSYEDGVIVINNKSFSKSLLVTPERIIENWDMDGPESLTSKSWSQVIDMKPEIMILGTGKKQFFPDPRVFIPLMDAGIGYEVMDSAAACRTYNVLNFEGRKIIAAIIV